MLWTILRRCALHAMNSNIRKPAMGATSVSSSISGDMSVGDILRKAKKELILKRICLAMFLLVLIALVVYFAVAGYFEAIADFFIALVG